MIDFIKGLSKKTILTVIGIIIVIIIVFLLLNIIGTKLFSKKDYNEIRRIMESAAMNYVDDNSDKYEIDEKSEVKIEVKKLIDNKYMKEIEKYTKNKKEKCDGEVIVTNTNDEYKYTAMLNCNKNIEDKTISKYIEDNEPIVENGNGLYKIDEKLVYRGDNVNNYLSFDEKIWRIIRIEDEKLVLISTEESERFEWDDRYNISYESEVGINDYNVSRIKETLQQEYDENRIVTEDNKKFLTKYSIPIGSRSTNETTTNNSVESNKLLDNQIVGLIAAGDYLQASTDSNCNTTTSVSCINYNYLASFENDYWTITADKDTTYYIYEVNKGLNLTYADAALTIKPVVMLGKNTAYAGGNGSENNPYEIR